MSRALLQRNQREIFTEMSKSLLVDIETHKIFKEKLRTYDKLIQDKIKVSNCIQNDSDLQDHIKEIKQAFSDLESTYSSSSVYYNFHEILANLEKEVMDIEGRNFNNINIYKTDLDKTVDLIRQLYEKCVEIEYKLLSNYSNCERFKETDRSISLHTIKEASKELFDRSVILKIILGFVLLVLITIIFIYGDRLTLYAEPEIPFRRLSSTALAVHYHAIYHIVSKSILIFTIIFLSSVTITYITKAER